MNYTFSLTKISSNKKTGPIATSYTSSNSCPETCPLKGSGCYAELGPTALHWRKVSDKAHQNIDWLVSELDTLKRGSMFRHNVAGDLPHDNGYIQKEALERITAAAAARSLKAFTYTHHLPERGQNALILAAANAGGFTVNLSANNVQQAIEYAGAYSLPVVTIVGPEFWQGCKSQDVGGKTLVRCPAEYMDSVQCIDCGLCAYPNRKTIVGFTVHGTRKKKAAIIAKG